MNTSDLKAELILKGFHVHPIAPIYLFICWVPKEDIIVMDQDVNPHMIISSDEIVYMDLPYKGAK